MKLSLGKGAPKKESVDFYQNLTYSPAMFQASVILKKEDILPIHVAKGSPQKMGHCQEGSFSESAH